MICYYWLMEFVIGIDEAGRGPLAGPVAVGAVLAVRDFDFLQLEGAKDSKLMTPEGREEIYEKMSALRERGTLNFAVAFSSSKYIDTYGIVPAIRSALARALSSFSEVEPREVEVLLDGSLCAPKAYENQQTIIRGDQSEPIISLASIAAKVERDRLMTRLALRYPAYGFEIHKGYGTAAHRKAIVVSGFSEIHRRTFCTRIGHPPSLQRERSR